LLSAGLLAASVASATSCRAFPSVSSRPLSGCLDRSHRRQRSFRIAGSDWVVANLVAGGHLFSTNTDPPWLAA